MKSPFIKYTPLVGLASALLGCSDNFMRIADEPSSSRLPIELAAEYPSATRASDNGFEDADRIGVFVLDYADGDRQGIGDSDIHASNIAFEFTESDTRWSTSTPIYWTSADVPADIIGYYPYSSNITSPANYPFSIARRQDVAATADRQGGYEASDFLWSRAEKCMPSDSRVNLAFQHMMAGVRISLKEGSGFGVGEWASLEKEIIIPNIKPTTAIDLSTGEATPATGDAVAVTPLRYGEDWRGVVPPQSVSAGTNIIDVTVGGVGYHLTKDVATEYAKGKLTSFTVTVNKRAESGSLEFNLTDEAIVPWIDNAEFRDGLIRNYVTVHVDKKGTLKNVLTEQGYAPATLESLKITGEINYDDFNCLRDDMTALIALNLYDCTVWDEDTKDVIPANALLKKTTLRHLVFPKNVVQISHGAFAATGLVGSLILPEGLKQIGGNLRNQINEGGAFMECKGLSGELELPSSLEVIDERTFYKTNLRGQLILPDALKAIGQSAFAFCKFSGELILPENLEELDNAAFQSRAFLDNSSTSSFTGDLIIPNKITEIGAETFTGCGFNGTLSLPEGITFVGDLAFADCNFKGELVLPKSLTTIGDAAFLRNKISSIVFPENLYVIGEEAFAYCKYLRGSIEIPRNVIKINHYLFYECSMLSELILHEDIDYVGGGILTGCNSLTSLVCKSEEPPLTASCNRTYNSYAETPLQSTTFEGLSKNNITLTVRGKSVKAYRMADGWREFSRIAENSNFVCRPAAVCALNSRHSENLTLNSEGDWEVIEKPEWCTLSASSGSRKTQIQLTVNELAKNSAGRDGKVVFRMKGTDITAECIVNQFDYQYSEDECVTLQKASRGNGIDILFVGDGWDAESIANGDYLRLVNEQMEHFFGVEPYATYRDRFNVYACIALSQEAGINTANTWRNTKFQTSYSLGSCASKSLLYFENQDDVFDYAVAHSPLTKEKMAKSLVIATLNSDEYGSGSIITESGSAISICCSSSDSYPMDTRGIIQHEACGHAFGKLAEERITSNRYVSAKEQSEIENAQWKGWYQNISLSGKPNVVPWSQMVFDPRYSDKVDVFEGAYGKARGVYRAEINSCMNYGIPYFSAAARMDIMRRILEYSGEGFSMEKFYATDSDKWGSTGASTRAALPDEGRQYVNSGLHHPVRIVKSKKY